MSADNEHLRGLRDLRDRVALSLTLEEVFTTALGDEAVKLRQLGEEQHARQVEDQVRHHRVGIMKHRAIMGASGIDV